MRASIAAAFVAVSWLTAGAHPGNGIVALSDTVAITGDALSNGIWRFEAGKPPLRLADKFHCHWVTKGRDGKLYAESLHERGGAWETSIYRLDEHGKPAMPVASGVDAAHGVFLVDASGAVVYQRAETIVVDAPGGKTLVGMLGSVKSLAWGKDGSLYAGDGDRILRAGADGVLKETARLEGRMVDKLYAADDGKPMVWGLAVADDGAIYAAVPALGKTVKIDPDGKQTTIATSENGWAAVGVAVYGRSIFLLESKTTERNNYGPRVRVVTPGKPVTLLGEINPER